MMKKRILSITLGLVFCLGLIVSVSATEVSKVGQAPTVSTGRYGHTGFVDTTGSLWMCGYNGQGQLGNGTQENSTTFIKVMDGVNSVSCGGDFTAAVKTDGSLWMWGNNYYIGLMGDTQGCVSSPKKVMDNVVSVSCGDNFVAVIKADSSLWIWGDNRTGNLGNGTTKNSTVPIRILENVSAVSCGGSLVAAIRTDGSLWTWGRVYDGDFLNWYNQSTPIQTMDDVIAVSCGFWNIAAVQKDGSLWVWGSNDGGQFADGSLTGWAGSMTPRKVLDNVVSVSCGSNEIAAVTMDASLWTWGENGNGQLGNGYTGTNYLKDGTPVQLKPAKVMENVAAVDCSGLNMIIVKTDGSVWGCGEARYVGGGNRTDNSGDLIQTVPVQLSGVTAKLSSPTTIVAKVGGFNDVLETDYYADPVQWAVDGNITSGTSATTFSPNATCSTAQILTFLWRAKGSPEPVDGEALPFSDIKESDYYYKAALWAKENGLISGTTFNGNTPCTRASTMTYMWKLAGSPSASNSSFTDVSSTADYSQAVAWAVEQGITAGTSATAFSPNQTCTRGQIVTFLYRAYK